MKITMIALGTHGDVAPIVALASGLQRAGHEVLVAAPCSFADMVQQGQLAFFPLRADMRAALSTEDGYRLMEQGTNPLRCWRLLLRMYLPLATQLIEDFYACCGDADAICFPSICYYPGQALAEALGVPSFAAFLTPLDPLAATPMFPVALFPPVRGVPQALVGLYNLFTYPLFEQVCWQYVRPTVNRWRRREGWRPEPLLGPGRRLARGEHLTLYGHSTAVLPRPAGWPRHACVTGYWFKEETSWNPPQGLVDFLAAGPPPICVGFGSMTEREPERLTRIVVDALRLAGQRGVLLSGWARIGADRHRLPDFVYSIDFAPHSWLLPRMAAAVHHGGAGTTGAAIRAGIPSVIVPFFLDQPFWAHQAHQIGAALTPIPRSKLTVPALAAALRQAVEDPQLRATTEALGRHVRAEDGVARAVAEIENFLAMRENKTNMGGAHG